MQKSIGKVIHKYVSIALTLIFIMGLLPQMSLPARAVTCGDFEVTGDTNYTYASNVLTFTGDGTYTVAMASGVTQTTTDKIVVNGGTESDPINITLDGVDIDQESAEGCAFELQNSSVVNLTLAEGTTNTLTSGGNLLVGSKCGYAGLHVPSGTAITIAGPGRLIANGGKNGAGIGGGHRGEGGEVTISGGTVYANCNYNYSQYYDIGDGVNTYGGTFTLNGDALVFLYNDNCVTPETTTYTHYSKSGQLYGFDSTLTAWPNGWSEVGIYAIGWALTYDDNGGSGGTSVSVPMGGTVDVINDDDLANPGYSFVEWNTAADGNGTSYSSDTSDSITITDNLTLYAIWEAEEASMISSVTPSGSDAPISGKIVIDFDMEMKKSVTGTVKLNGTILSGGTWSNYGKTYNISYSGLSYNQSYTIDISDFVDSYGTTMTSASYSLKTEAPAELKSLSVSTGTLSTAFDADTAAYSVDATGINSIGVTAATEDPGATLTINGVSATSGTETTVNLNNGANMIPIVVTSQDGVTQKSYIISVNGTVSNANLSSLSLSACTLSFGAETTDYYVTVGSDVTSIDLTASASDAKAVMLLDGTILAQNGTKTISLSTGENTVEIMVIAQDATLKKYTLTINRGNSDATLSNMTLSDGTLSPAFNTTTYAYTATVLNSVDSLTVTPTTTDNSATVTVGGNSAATSVNLTVGTNTISVEITGSDGVTTKEYTITVTRRAEITITNTSLPVSIIGGNYSVTMAAEGGDGSFSWSATGLPATLSINSATGVISGTPGDADKGNHSVTITATDGNAVTATETYTLVIQKGCGGAYIIVSDGDAAYTGSYRDDGIPTLTVNSGVYGFTYFGVNISKVAGHAGKEICVFVLKRNGLQIAFSFNRADYDIVDYSGAAFNVRAGDVIEVYIVDALSNSTNLSPTIL